MLPADASEMKKKTPFKLSPVMAESKAETIFRRVRKIAKSDY
jgi:hypothetical protein